MAEVELPGPLIKGEWLIDTRELRNHVGFEKRDYVYAHGHIQGSRNMPYQFLNSMKGGNRYFDRDSCLGLLDSLRIDTGDSLILFCNSGYEAS